MGAVAARLQRANGGRRGDHRVHEGRRHGRVAAAPRHARLKLQRGRHDRPRPRGERAARQQWPHVQPEDRRQAVRPACMAAIRPAFTLPGAKERLPVSKT